MSKTNWEEKSHRTFKQIRERNLKIRQRAAIIKDDEIYGLADYVEALLLNLGNELYLDREQKQNPIC
jgi:hypothetical protein